MDELQRFIDLVNKTGDKLIIFDRYQPENSCVILGLNDYEELVDFNDSRLDLTEEELADKINNDIAIWKNEQVLSDFSEDDNNIVPSEADWPDEINWSQSSEESLSEDTMTEQEPVEELNYLYPESEAVLTPITDLSEDVPTNELTESEAFANSGSISTEESAQATKPDFESLGDIIGSKYERNNNWSIPSDRKRLADDKFASRYESIGF